MSEPWARFQTDQTIRHAEVIESMGGDASNDGRINNSVMDSMASQIEDLSARQSGIVQTGDIYTAPFTTGSQFAVATLQIPRPTDSARAGWVAAQFTARNNTSRQTEVYATFLMDGRIFHRDSRSVPTTNFEPSSWNGDKALTGYTGFIAFPATGGTLTIELQAEAAFDTSGPRTITFADIRASYQYGQAV